MRRKMALLLVIILSGLFVLTACSTENKKDNKVENSSAQESKDDLKDKEFVVGTIQFANHIALDRSREGFFEALKEAGIKYKEELVNAQGDISLTTTAAQKMAASKVDIIHAIATPAAQGAKNVISDIPIIFSAVTDPVSAELVADKNAPGANVTGVTDYFTSEKQLETFLKIFPEVKTIGVLYSTDEINSQIQIDELKGFAEQLNVTIEVVGVNSINDVPQAMNSLVTKIDGFFAITDNLSSNSATIIGNILADKKIPSIAAEQGPVENGLLFTDGVDYKNLGKKAGEIAVEILLEGKSPSEIPVFYPNETTKVVNKEVADKLGISSDSLLFKDAEIVNK